MKEVPVDESYPDVDEKVKLPSVDERGLIAK